MRLTDITLVEGNHFVAMEYYGLILNRTYLILLTNTHLIGIVANGLVSIKGPSGSLAEMFTTKLALAIDGDLDNPFSYLNEKYIRRVNKLNLLNDDLIQSHRANFRVELVDFPSVRYDSTKKWGMGYYPHDGKVYVEVGGKVREFIILGNQSGQAVSDWIQEKTMTANKANSSDAKRRAAD